MDAPCFKSLPGGVTWQPLSWLVCRELRGCAPTSAPEPPQFLASAHPRAQPAKGSPFRGAGRASRPEGSRRAVRYYPFSGNYSLAPSTLPAIAAARPPPLMGRLLSRASPAQKKAPLSKGAGRVSGLGDSDGPCRIARYTRRRPGIPPPRLRSAPPFDKGGFLRGRRPLQR